MKATDERAGPARSGPPTPAQRRAALVHLARLGALPFAPALASLGPSLGPLSWLASPAPARAQAAPAAPATTRVALVVGNAAYPAGAALRNPARDAQSMAVQLTRLGFEVVQARDATRAALRDALARAAGRLDGRRGTGLLYYAGHGLQVGLRNFMLPVDDLPAKEADVPRLAIDVGEVVEAFRRAGTKTNIVVLDACRDNPLAEPGAARGLAPIDAPPNTFLAYATAPGNVAEDGSATDGNGLYTGFLLKELQRPGARIEDVFKRVRLGVRQASQGRQVPWESTSLEEEFFFDTTPPAPPPPRESEALALAEKRTWERIRGNARAEDLFAFLLVFPEGQFAEQALFLLNRRTEALLRPAAAPLSTRPAQRTGDAPREAPAPAPAPSPPAYDSYGYGAPAPRPARPPAPSPAPPPPTGPTAPVVLTYRGERFRPGDACEWIVRPTGGRPERGRGEIRVVAADGLDVRFDSASPPRIVRDGMGARLRDGFAVYEDPVIDLPAEYSLGTRWTGSARLRLQPGGAEALLLYSGRVVGRQAIVVGNQSFEAWVVEAVGQVTTRAGDGSLAASSSYASRLWALPQFGVPMRQELRVLPREGRERLPVQDEIVECTWVRLRT